MNTKQLQKLKTDIDNARQEVSRQEGSVQSAMNQLKEHGVESVENAQAKIQEIDAEIKDLQEKYDSKAQELEERLDETGR